MKDASEKLKLLENDLEKAKQYFYQNIKDRTSPIQLYTHIDADGITSGAILGKALYREGLPFQITVVKQLEIEEIIKIAEKVKDYKNFMIFSDFGSGQYLELQKYLNNNGEVFPFLILDHHIPQKISNKEEVDLIEELHQETSPWHVNPYFYGFNGSEEVSGAGMSYQFAKCLNKKNIDLSPVALIGAIGDIQNKGKNKSFTGLNDLILEDAKKAGLVEVTDDLNFSPIKPLNEEIAYSSDIILPGLTNDVNRTLIFLQSLGIIMENSEGKIKSLSELDQKQKQEVSTKIIEYATLKSNIEPHKIVEKLIINRYLFTKETPGTELHDCKEFSNLLNACGRTGNSSLGIAIAMGDRKNAYIQGKEHLQIYKTTLMEAINWVIDNNKIQEKEYIQYYFGEDMVPESIIGTISTMLIFDTKGVMDKGKPIFGLAIREDEGVYKISGRAHQGIVKKGVNLSDALREAGKLSGVEALGGGHPPAAGTKVAIEKIDVFLENCNQVIRNQLRK